MFFLSDLFKDFVWQLLWEFQLNSVTFVGIEIDSAFMEKRLPLDQLQKLEIC